MPMKLRRTLRGGGERGDRQGRGVGAEHDVGADRGLRLGGRLGLHVALLEHRLDHEVAVLQQAVVGARRDAGEQLVALGGLGAALVDLVGDELVRMRLALLGRFLVTIDQHHVDAGLRRDIRDAGAHQAGAEHADLAERVSRHALGPARALVELPHRDEQRADHGGRFGRAQDLGEPAQLDAQRDVHRHLQALVHALQDRARGRIIVVGLAAIDRVGGREHHHVGLGVDEAAGQLEAVDVPRRLGLGIGLDPLLRGLDEVLGRHDGVDHLHALGAVDTELVALGEHREGIARRHHAGDALRAAGAGKQADLDLGQADARLRVLRGDAMVAREAELERAAERGAVDGGGPRLAAGFQPPVEQRELAALLEQLGVRRLLALLACHVGKGAVERLQHGEVGAAGERVLARGDDRALDGGLVGDAVDDRAQLLDHVHVDDVHRAARHVPGDERDAVGIDVDGEVLGHG